MFWLESVDLITFSESDQKTLTEKFRYLLSTL